MKAIWNNVVLAESDDTIIVEGNHYFPIKDIHTDYFSSSAHKTTCPWKGTASYYHIEVDDKVNKNAAWYYASPKDEAAHVKGRIAFWKGVEIQN